MVSTVLTVMHILRAISNSETGMGERSTLRLVVDSSLGETYGTGRGLFFLTNSETGVGN